MAELLATVLVMAALSAIVGQAVWVIAGRTGWTCLAPATGLAALLVVSDALIRLPGQAASARALVVLLAVLSAVVLVRRRQSWAGLGEVGGVAAFTLGAACLPFLFNGRVGILGVLDNGDLTGHLVLSDALLTGADALSSPFRGGGYPTGPHAFAAVFTSFGTDPQTSFTAMLVTVPAVTAVTALAALNGLSRGWRVAAAVLVGLPYLAAAYLIQASFKEPLQALLVLAFVLALRQQQLDGASRARSALPLGVLVAGSLVNYSYAGLVWPVGGVLAWLALELVARRGLPPLSLLRRLGKQAALALAVVVLAALPAFGRQSAFAASVSAVGAGNTTGGNVGAPIRAYQAIGLWLSHDFRSHPNLFYAGMLSAVAFAVAVYGLVWWIRRRDLVVPAGVIVCVALFLYARQRVTPYYDAKALVIASPLIVAMTLSALATEVPRAGALLRRHGVTRAGWARLAMTVFIIAGAAVSSTLTLRAAVVGPGDHAEELATLRPLVKGRPTLFLGQDDYVFWELRGARLAVPVSYVGNSLVPYSFRPDVGFAPGRSPDFDALDRGNLDRFHFIVAPRTAVASTPPVNWRQRRATRSYVLWERHGPTANREVLSGGGVPGNRLDCREARGRRLAERRGQATIVTPPISGDFREWRVDGRRPPFNDSGGAVVRAGDTALQSLRLPVGRWDISIGYRSPVPVRVRGPGLDATLPPSIERVGPVWSAGTVLSTGARTRIAATPLGPPPLARDRGAAVGGLVATRVGEPLQLVPLRGACGRYIDFYTLERPTSRAGA